MKCQLRFEHKRRVELLAESMDESDSLSLDTDAETEHVTEDDSSGKIRDLISSLESISEHDSNTKSDEGDELSDID